MRLLSKHGPTVRLSEVRITEHLLQGVDTLRRLGRVYDDGHSAIAFTMASEISRVLTSNGVATRLRGTKRFTTISRELDDSNLVDDNKLVSAMIHSGDECFVEFQPAFASPNGGPYGVREVDFRTWWNRDVIFRGGVAVPDSHGMIPLDSSLHLPSDKRIVVTRRTFIEQMRNKLGAHLDEEIPEVLDHLLRATSFGGILAVQTPQGMLSTQDGSLKMRISPAAAMMRQICEELIRAYS